VVLDLAQKKVMSVSTEMGDTMLDERKIKMNISYELLPQEACLEKRGVSYWRIGIGTRVSPKAFDSHQEENMVNLARRGNDPWPRWLVEKKGTELALLEKREGPQGHEGLSVKH
jgi:hypothetical protein